MANRLWRYVIRRDQHWEERGIPFVPSKPIVGSSQLFNPKPQHEIDVERHKTHGRMYGTFEGKKPVLVLAEPELLEKIFRTDFPAFPNRRGFNSGNAIFDNMVGVATGEKWRRIRDVIQPTFQNKKIFQMAEIWYESSATVIKNFANNAGRPVDGKKLFTTYSLDVIALAAFATKVESHQDPNNVFIQEAKKIFTQTRTWRLSMWLFFPVLARLFKVSPFSPEGMAFFKKVALDVIEKRNRSGEVRNDFLQLLIDAEKEFPTTEASDGCPVVKSGRKRFLTRDELIAQCVLFFVAGYDTTSTTLAFASYLLALNPDIQERAREEVDSRIKACGGRLTYEAVSGMNYLHSVFNETLRMFPVATRLERVAGRDYELGDTGIVVAKDTIVAVPLYAMHHDHEFYPEPEKFRPDRFFVDEERKTRHPFSFLPFGAGPRNCLGFRFATLQMKYCMSYMLSQLVIKRCPETKVPLEMTSPQNILQPKEIMFVVEKRENPSFNGLGDK